MITATTLTTSQAARLLGVAEWRMLSLFRRGLIPEPRRLGQYRVLTGEDVERARLALVELGVLPGPECHAEGAPS